MAKSPKTSDDDDHLCGCDVDFSGLDATTDEELPSAVGGIALAGEGDEIDGCDIHFDDSDATLDEDLPAATGGVMKNA